MRSDAVYIRRNSSFIDEVAILQAQAFGAVNPIVRMMQPEMRTRVCA
jgi:hypothetical protein